MTKSPPQYDLAPLVSLVSELSDGSVLWVGHDRAPGLAAVAASTKVRIVDPAIGNFSKERANWTVITDVSTLGDDAKSRLAELIEGSARGLIVRWLGREIGLEERLQASFKHTRLYKQSTFAGSSLIANGDGVLLDDSLARGVQAEARVLVCSHHPLDLDSFVVTRHPSAKPVAAYDELEARLVERGRYVATLEKELERQQALVRDVLEHWEKVQNEQPDSRDAAEMDPATVRRLRDENATLALQVVAAQERAKELKTAAVAKDALVTRLQFELADFENAGSSDEGQVARLREENDRLREAVLGAAVNVDTSPALLAAWKEGRQVLERLRWLLRDLLATESDQALHQTVVGIEPPITPEEHRASKD